MADFKRWSAMPLSCAALMTCCQIASAAEPANWRLTPGIFGTLGAIYHAEDGVEYRRDISQPHGAESDEVDLATDTLVGGQLNIGYRQKFEAVGQVISKLDSDNSWRPDISRAFLRYVPDESLMLRAGHIPIGLYLRVDSRDVAYTYLTVRPPVETSGYLSNDTMDGADLQWTRVHGADLWRLRLFGGLGSPVISASVSVPDVWIGGMTIDLFRGSWQFRLGAGLGQIRGGGQINPLIEPLRATGEPQAIELADVLADTSNRLYQATGALAYDRGPLQFEAMVQRLTGEGRSGYAFYNGYATLGYKLGELTPYASFALMDSIEDIRPAGLDDPVYAMLDQAALAAQVQSGTVTDQHTLSLGLRYDFARQFDLKLQIDRVSIDNSHLIIDNRPDPTANIDMTVFGVTMDFAF